MDSYLQIVREILEKGEPKKDRTGVGTKAIFGVKFEHDMGSGFPLLTTKKMPFRLIASELEFFIKGLTDKAWLQERNNHIWDEWCSPVKVPYGHDEATKKKMLEEKDLGPVYGFQWRHFGASYIDEHADYKGKGFDQLKELVHLLKTDPSSRRMILSAWNPVDQGKMALPPCHYAIQVTVLGGKLNLLWHQRSVDTMLGLPFNIASYGLLLHLLAREAKLREGKLVGFLGDVHIYDNHVEGAKAQLTRAPKKLPKISTQSFTSIFDWKYTDSQVEGYESHPALKFPIAV
ncbi:thymidylate synthase [Candidatus Woesearchaeota archaeon]|nr:thymidylate synthase [Candidatus Woesearchaeota archaeon]